MIATTPASLQDLDLGRYRLLILDFDGVLTRLPLDWPALKSELADLCRDEMGLRVSFSPMASGRDRVLAHGGAEALARVDAWVASRELEALESATLVPEVRDLIRRHRHMKVAICSSNARVVLTTAVQRFGLEDRVDVFVGREDVRDLKPSPEGLRKILEAVDCDPGEAAFLGDRDVDAAAGRAAGIETWILGGAEPERLEAIASAHSYEEGFNGRLTRYRARAIREMVPKGGSLLELGCAGGALSAALADHFGPITVAEASAGYLDQARRRLPGGTTFLHGLVEDLDPGGRFSCVLASGLLEHVEDPVAVARRAAGWLEPGGVAVFLVPNARSLHRRIGVAMGVLGHLRELQAQDHEVGHRRYYDRESLRRDLEAAGLEILREGGVFLKPLANWQMEGWDEGLADAFYEVGRELPDHCAELIVTARRPASR